MTSNDLEHDYSAAWAAWAEADAEMWDVTVGDGSTAPEDHDRHLW